MRFVYWINWRCHARVQSSGNIQVNMWGFVDETKRIDVRVKFLREFVRQNKFRYEMRLLKVDAIRCENQGTEWNEINGNVQGAGCDVKCRATRRAKIVQSKYGSRKCKKQVSPRRSVEFTICLTFHTTDGRWRRLDDVTVLYGWWVRLNLISLQNTLDSMIAYNGKESEIYQDQHFYAVLTNACYVRVCAWQCEVLTNWQMTIWCFCFK